MMRRAFNALCHFRSVIPSLVKGDEGGFSASIPRHARQWLSGIDLQKKRKVKNPALPGGAFFKTNPIAPDVVCVLHETECMS